MSRRAFDILVILIIGASLLVLNQFDLLGQMAKFMFIPILAFYFLGQFAQRKFQK